MSVSGNPEAAWSQAGFNLSSVALSITVAYLQTGTSFGTTFDAK